MPQTGFKYQWVLQPISEMWGRAQHIFIINCVDYDLNTGEQAKNK